MENKKLKKKSKTREYKVFRNKIETRIMLCIYKKSIWSKLKSRLFAAETSRYIMGSGNVHAPQFASSLENVTVYVDDRVELICHVSGYPLPSVFWTKDSQPLKVNPPRLYADGGEYTYRLVISRVCLEDEGLYVCHAQNEGGHAESSCYMNVLPYGKKGNILEIKEIIRALN